MSDLQGWLQHAHNAGCTFHQIQKAGMKAAPRTGWNSDGELGVSPEFAAARLAAYNYACRMGARCWALDLDTPEAASEFTAAMGEAKTLSTRTPRGGLHLLFIGTLPQKGGIDGYLDVRGSEKGYLLTPGSKLILDAYGGDRAKAPDGDPPWHYAVGDVVPMIEAPQAVIDLLANRYAEDEARKEAARQAKREAASAKAKERYRERNPGAATRAPMLEALTAQDWIGALGLRPKGDGDYWGPCPLCGDGTSATRFRVKPDGHVFCRNCCPTGADVARLREIEEHVFPHRVGGNRKNLPRPPKRNAATGAALPEIYLVDGGRDGPAGWAARGGEVLAQYGKANPSKAVYVVMGTEKAMVRVARSSTPMILPGKVRMPEGTLHKAAMSYRTVARESGPLADWLKGNEVSTDPKPDQVAYMLDAAAPDLPVLAGLADGPTMRADGVVIDLPGYDPTGLYVDYDPAKWPKPPANPTHADAKAAAERVLDVLADTEFESDADRGVFLSLTASVLARDYAGGNVPIHLVDANVKGAGKGTLTEVASVIATGALPTMLATNDKSNSGRHRADAAVEDKKRLQTAAMVGARLAVIDNQDTGVAFGNSTVDMVATLGTDWEIGMLQDRKLGKNDETAMQAAPWRTVLAVTGNNLTVTGDTPDRVVCASIQSKHENPREQANRSTHPDVVEYAMANREALYVDVLTMLRAHRLAMDSGVAQPMKRIGSYGGWSTNIRSAIVWALGDAFDPWVTNARMKETADPEQKVAMEFLAAWYAKWGDSNVNVNRDVVPVCTPGEPGYDQDFAEIVRDLPIGAPRGKAAVNDRALGKWMARRKKRPGEYSVHDGTKHRTWRVVERGALVAPEPEPDDMDDVVFDDAPAADLTSNGAAALRSTLACPVAGCEKHYNHAGEHGAVEVVVADDDIPF